MVLLFNIAVTAVLRFLVLLLFYRKEWLQCVHFAFLMSGISLLIGSMLVDKLYINWLYIEIGIFIVEAFAIRIFWNEAWLRSFLISLLINLVCGGFFPLLEYLGMNIKALLAG